MNKGPGQNNGRLFIVEPTFILKVGHVSQCTYLFSSHSKSMGFEVFVLVPECAPFGTRVEEEYELQRILPNTYESFLIEGMKYRYPMKKVISLALRLLGTNWHRRITFFIGRLHWFVNFRAKSRKKWKALDSQFGFTEEDRFIFPNGDYLTLSSLISYLKSQGANRAPSIGVRFINVMENNGIPKLLTSINLFRLIERSRRRGMRITVTAETEGYRALIGQYVTDTFVCEYPLNAVNASRKPISLSQSPITIGSLGSARADKGFTKLQYLVTRLLVKKGSEIRVLIQEGTSSWGVDYDETLAELRQYSQVEFLPGYLNQLELESAVNRCNILLMPYDEQTYQYRGSAILFEAADMHIPMLVPSRTGLGEVIRKYGLGATFTSEHDLIAGLETVLRIDPHILEARFVQYNIDRQIHFERLILG